MSTLAMSVDNPLFVKHVRSRLRRGQIIAPAVIVGVICLCIAYACYVNNWYVTGWAFGGFLAVQVVVLGIMGATQVSSAVGGARESGILDFHRVSPLSPLAVTLGFFFGAPVREYTLAALTLPFVLACAAKDAPSVWPAIQVEIAVLLGCWLLHSLALLTALATKKPKAGAKGTVGIVIFALMFAGPSGFMGLASVASAVGDSPTLEFYGMPLPWLASVLLYAVPLLFFFMLASVRKMQSDRAHAYSKPEAVACLAVEALIVLGGLWSIRDFAYLPLGVIYSTSALALVLILTITPNLGEFAKGVRRAERDGRTHVSYWSDLALNRVAVFTLCAIVLLASTVAWYFVAPGPFPPQWGGAPGGERAPSYSVPIAVAVLSVAAFGLALQFFLLVAPRRGATLLGLFVFLTWLLPPVIGSILRAAQVGPQVAMAIVATSPIAGIAMATDLGPMSETGTDAMKLAAVLPALVFAMLFNNAVTWARRREVAAIHGGPALAKPEAEPDPLAV
ncbi:MAG TPA: hypothetical protein VGH33_15625 [Isosphaeraceae bacterium]